MEGKERQSLSKDTRSKRSICTYARMRLAVADLTVLTVPRLPVQRGPAATRCDGSGSLLPGLRRLNLLAWSGAHPLLQRCSSGRRHHELETRPRASFFCRALHQSTLKAFTCTLVRVRIGSNSFAACRARLLLSPNVICFGSSAEHAPSRVTSHTQPTPCAPPAMSFFGFDASLPRDRGHQTNAPGFGQHDAFASFSGGAADDDV